MKYTVSILEGALLDAAVAMALNGGELEANGFMQQDGGGVAAWDGDHASWRGWCPSTDWRAGGPIIEREGISLMQLSEGPANPKWAANFDISWFSQELDAPHVGPTPLVAAMRAYVASKLGDEIEL